MNVMRVVSLVLLSIAAFSASAADELLSPKDIRAAIHNKVPYCPQGVERILPGQYYFCSAVHEYSNGHFGLARSRLRDAAYWASKPAQFVLGLMYYNGNEGPGNRPLGVAWMALSAERHDPRFEPAFTEAYVSLSPEERKQASAYWNELRPEYSDATAGRRAHRIYLYQTRHLGMAMGFTDFIFIAGLGPTGLKPTSGKGSGELPGSPGSNTERVIRHAADELFEGMEGTVTVGEVQPVLVPLGSVTGKTQTPSP